MVICMYFLEADDVTAVRCLASFLMSKSRMKCADDSEVDIPHVLVEAKVSVRYLVLLYISLFFFDKNFKSCT